MQSCGLSSEGESEDDEYGVDSEIVTDSGSSPYHHSATQFIADV
jgi:hypothetical protein